MKQQLVFEAPRRGLPPRHLADLDEARARRRRRGAGPAAVSRQATRPPVLRPADRRPAADDRPAGRGPRSGGRGPVPEPADGHPRNRLRRRPNPQDAVAGGRRHHLRVGADALPAAQHGVHFVAGGLRHGVPVLRDRPGRSDPKPVDRRDRRTGTRRGRGAARRLGRPVVQRGVHGHGGAAGQLRQGAGGGASHHRPDKPRFRHLGAVGDGVDGRSGPGDPQTRRRAARR